MTFKEFINYLYAEKICEEELKERMITVTKERKDKLLWVLGRHAKLIKDRKDELNVTDRVLLTYIRWIKTLIVNQRALNEEYKILKMYEVIDNEKANP